MSLYSVIDPPVQSDEVVTAVHALLQNGAGKPSDLTIHKGRQPETLGGMWGIVREVVEPGGRFESENRFDLVPVQVMFEVKEGVQDDPDAWLQDAHNWAFGLLVGQTLSLSSGDSLLPIERRYRPSGAAYDAETFSFYSTATYLCPVTP